MSLQRAESTGVALSERELEILTLIARGRSNRQIAEECFLSINSVKTYVRSGYRKIGVARRTQAVLWAIAHGLVPLEVALREQLASPLPADDGDDEA